MVLCIRLHSVLVREALGLGSSQGCLGCLGCLVGCHPQIELVAVAWAVLLLLLLPTLLF